MDILLCSNCFYRHQQWILHEKPASRENVRRRSEMPLHISAQSQLQLKLENNRKKITTFLCETKIVN